MSYQSIYTGDAIDNGITNIQQLFNLIYPVGSYYMSSDSANPSTKFGGTWEQITDRMIMAAGSSYAVGTTGGSASHTHTSATHTHTTAGHTLTVSEMPSHQHQVVKYVGMVNNTAAFGINDSNFDGLVGSDVMSATVNSVAVTDAQKATIIGYTGGGASHSHGDTGSTTPGATGSSSHLPPYIVAYIWRRTA